MAFQSVCINGAGIRSAGDKYCQQGVNQDAQHAGTDDPSTFRGCGSGRSQNGNLHTVYGHGVPRFPLAGGLKGDNLITRQLAGEGVNSAAHHFGGGSNAERLNLLQSEIDALHIHILDGQGIEKVASLIFNEVEIGGISHYSLPP